MKRVEVEWECGFCRKKATTYQVERMPDRWERVELIGLDGHWREQDLCKDCLPFYRKGLEQIRTTASDFWWCHVRNLASGTTPTKFTVPWEK